MKSLPCYRSFHGQCNADITGSNLSTSTILQAEADNQVVCECSCHGPGGSAGVREPRDPRPPHPSLARGRAIREDMLDRSDDQLYDPFSFIDLSFIDYPEDTMTVEGKEMDDSPNQP